LEVGTKQHKHNLAQDVVENSKVAFTPLHVSVANVTAAKQADPEKYALRSINIT
jgi:hypothetical protein